jgi:hypothetical protein
MTAKPNYTYSLRSEWPRRVETPSAIGANFVDMLDALSRVDPIFGDWILLDPPNPSSGDAMTDYLNIKLVPLDAARQRITQIIENNVSLNDAREPCPDEGYAGLARVGGWHDDSRTVHMRLEAGGPNGGSTALGFGKRLEATDPTIVTYSMYRAVLLAINRVWRPRCACAYAFRVDRISVPGAEVAPGVVGTRIDSPVAVPIDPTFPYSIFHIPWIAYLSAEDASDVTPPRDILTERTPDGGILMSATTDRLDPMNFDHARRARMIADLMIARLGSDGRAQAAR